jgi:5-methylcytosine-specific restriction endonuclease McrA
MSASAAGKRIRVSRAARRFPVIFEMIRTGELHVSGVNQLAAHLTDDNYEEVLRRARHRSMREIDLLIAQVSPKPDVAWSLRALPPPLGGGQSEGIAAGHAGPDADGQAGSTSAALASEDARPSLRERHGTPNGTTSPLSPRRYKLQVTIGQEARDALEELRNLLSHQIPDGDPAIVVERALAALLSETKKERAALTKNPRKRRKKGGRRTRAIPANVRRKVFKRDGGQCAFVDDEGRRCASAWQLEYHHCVPFGRDGPHSVENVELRCRAHNQFEAERDYGRELMAARRGGASSSPARV